MKKRFGLNITRTIVIEQVVHVMASNSRDAMNAVQKHYDDGKGGHATVLLKGAKGLASEADGEITQSDTVTVDDAYQEEE